MESEPFFPTTRPEEVDAVNGVPQMEMVTYSGLTKREWFAGQLMPHLLLTYRVEDAAKLAASAADALIAALETKP